MNPENTLSQQFLSEICKTPIVGILRGYDFDTCMRIAKVFECTGLKYLEVTMNTKAAEEIIQKLRINYPKLCIGAGTVCSVLDLNKAIKAGAQFIVTPIVNDEVIENCVSQNIPVFPGAYTPSEIYQAWTLGATAVKVFPATALGSSYIKSVLGPLNTIKLLPTGGISKDNIKEFLETGAIGVGMGSTLFRRDLIESNNWTALKIHILDVLEKVNN